jgi:hypothetical protein
VGATENWNETDFLCWALNGYLFLEEDCVFDERKNECKKEGRKEGRKEIKP